MTNNTNTRSFFAAQQQLQALNCENFEVGLFKRDTNNTGKMMIKRWAADEIISEKNFKFLQARNARCDEDIFIRSAESDIVLIDDLELYFVEQLQRDSRAVVTVTETSADNYQCFFKTGTTDAQLKTEIARILAERYCADIASADHQHFGRFAGFTNRKKSHQKNNKQPFVLLIYTQQNAQHDEKLIELAQSRIKTAHAQHSTRRALLSDLKTDCDIDALLFYAKRYYDALRARYETAFDMSRADWMLCCSLHNKKYDADIVADVLRLSTDIERKKNADYYINRTVEKSKRWTALRKSGLTWKEARNQLIS